MRGIFRPPIETIKKCKDFNTLSCKMPLYLLIANRSNNKMQRHEYNLANPYDYNSSKVKKNVEDNLSSSVTGPHVKEMVPICGAFKKGVTKLGDLETAINFQHFIRFLP